MEQLLCAMVAHNELVAEITNRYLKNVNRKRSELQIDDLVKEVELTFIDSTFDAVAYYRFIKNIFESNVKKIPSTGSNDLQTLKSTQLKYSKSLVDRSSQTVTFPRSLSTQTAIFTSPFVFPNRGEPAKVDHVQSMQSDRPIIVVNKTEHKNSFTDEQQLSITRESKSAINSHLTYSVVESNYEETDDDPIDIVEDNTYDSSNTVVITGTVRKPSFEESGENVIIESFVGMSRRTARQILYEKLGEDDYRALYKRLNGGSRFSGEPSTDCRDGFSYYECVGCCAAIKAVSKQCRQHYGCQRERISRNQTYIQHYVDCPLKGNPVPRRIKYHEHSGAILWAHNRHHPGCTPATRMQLAVEQVSRLMSKYVKDDSYLPQEAYEAALEEGPEVANKFSLAWDALRYKIGPFSKHQRRLKDNYKLIALSRQQVRQKAAPSLRRRVIHTDANMEYFQTLPPDTKLRVSHALLPDGHIQVIYEEIADNDVHQTDEIITVAEFLATPKLLSDDFKSEG